MPIGDRWLQARRHDRQALLDRAVEILVADERVVAAWLAGSIGQGMADDLSDLDLWVVVEDAHMPEIVADPIAFVTQIAPPLLIQEAQWNAPVEAAYLLVLYPGQAGPQQIDWYWLPQSCAQVPPHTQVLFDRVGVATPTPVTLTSHQAQRRASELVLIFAAMSFITAKKIARGEVWTAIKMLSTMQLELDEVQAILDGRWEGTPYTDRRTEAMPATRRQQLSSLRGMVDTMRGLMAEVASRGGSVPTAAVNDIEQFFDLVEAMLEDPAGA